MADTVHYYLLYAKDYLGAIDKLIAIVKAPSYGDAVELLGGKIKVFGDVNVTFEISKDKLNKLPLEWISLLEPTQHRGYNPYHYILKELPLFT